MVAQETPLSAFPRLLATADYIAALQHSSGALPWFTGGITDPWDHVEAMMGLEGLKRGSRRAYDADGRNDPE